MYKFLLSINILLLLLFNTFCDNHMKYFDEKNYELFASSNIRHSKSRLLKQNEQHYNKLRGHEHTARVIRSDTTNTTHYNNITNTNNDEPINTNIAKSQAHISHAVNIVQGFNASSNVTNARDTNKTTANRTKEVFTSDDNAPNENNMALVTKFLKIVESQHLTGANCTAGTDLNLGENVVDRYAHVCTH